MATGDKFLLAFIIMLGINIVLGLTQVSMININPNSQRFFNLSTSPAGAYIHDGELVNGSISELPSEVKGESGSVITGGSFSLFTDPVSTIKNFFINTLGGKYITAMFRAPYDFVKSAGVPQDVAIYIGVLWYGFMILLLALVIIGR